MTKFGLPRRQAVLLAVAAVVVFEVAVIALVFARETAARRAEQARMASSQSPDVWWTGNLGKAISCPPTVKAKQAKIEPDEAVVGVEVDGRARAYRLEALLAPSGHVVNDLIGAVPVSVAYCDLTDCLRVYSADRRGSTPLEVEIVGLLNSEMVVKIGGTLYYQESGTAVEPSRAPGARAYRLLTPTRTTWKEWVRRHPETDVYIGDRRSFPRGYLRQQPSSHVPIGEGKEGSADARPS